MNSVRTLATPSDDGTLTIQVPEEHRQQQVEVIILPVVDYGIPKDKYFFENLAKIQTMDKRDADRTDARMREAMAETAQQAVQNGLTPKILDDILNDPE